MNAPEFQATGDASLGDILRRTKGLSPNQVKAALDYQEEHKVRFGDAIVALGLAHPQDIVWALSQQFRYPYSPTAGQALDDELVVANDPFSEEVEAFRDLRSQLLMSVMGGQEGRRALALVSPGEGDGKSFIAANLAVAFSQLPGRTLLIDADLRAARLHKLFGVDSGAGLTSILAGRAEANVIKPVDDLPNLYLLPAGIEAPNPVELLQQSAFSLLLCDLLARFDHVLVDTPAASRGSDARIIATHCGSALVIARKDQSSVPHLQKLVKQLNKGSVKLAGVLMNEH